MSAASSALAVIHRHASGSGCLAAARERRRNTTIVIGADQSDGILLLDLDVQADVCADADELIEQLLLVVEALHVQDPLAEAGE